MSTQRTPTPSVLDITRALAAGLTYEMHSPYWDSTSGKRDMNTEVWLSGNAAFIVRAVNAHDALVAALREIDERLSDGSSPTVRAIARAAIAQAQGQS